MLGAITGDIIGSIYEFNNIKTKKFDLFTDKNRFSDDTVMTLAVAEALMNGGKTEDYIQSMTKFGKDYLNKISTLSFGLWIIRNKNKIKNHKPYYNSRTATVIWLVPHGWIAKLSEPFEDGLKLTEDLAKVSAEITNNHPEVIKGAQAIASSIFFMRYGKSKNAIDEYKNKLKDYIQNRYEYNLNFSLDEIHPDYIGLGCEESVPAAIISFLESENFEDAIRNAISLKDNDALTKLKGGIDEELPSIVLDSCDFKNNTSSITGSIAEAAYVIPEDIKEKAMSYLDDRLKGVYENWTNFIKSLGN
ncbi:ADP-ribosylglycohydrolase family protein [Brachyspira sp.]|uniref:ADP-ribosylglycohydrolase family protein n=1 Tax=Brachyspira sp. TaxID=1977261 RepID=UPI003D7EF2BA